jgi:hypothetical protein
MVKRTISASLEVELVDELRKLYLREVEKNIHKKGENLTFSKFLTKIIRAGIKARDWGI